MVNKHFVRRSIERLRAEIRAQERNPHIPIDPVAVAELDHFVRLALPRDSRLLHLFNHAVEKPDYPMLERVLSAAQEWNAARDDESASEELTEDIDRILGRRFLKYPVVQIAVAALIGAMAFSVYGVVKFRGMEFNVKEMVYQRGEEATSAIDKQKEDAMHVVSDLQAQAQLTSERVSKLTADIASAKQTVSDMTTTAVRDLSRKKQDELDQIVDAASRSISDAKNNAIKNIDVASTVTQLNTTVAEAKRTISRAAEQRAEEVKAQVTPEFSDMLRKDQASLTALDQALRRSESRRELLDAAIRVLGVPSKGYVGLLAGTFNKAVTAVYVVLGLLVVSFILNVVVFIRKLRG
jgi:hypothetical protein